jgi:hypothetical protein
MLAVMGGIYAGKEFWAGTEMIFAEMGTWGS